MYMSSSHEHTNYTDPEIAGVSQISVSKYNYTYLLKIMLRSHAKAM